MSEQSLISLDEPVNSRISRWSIPDSAYDDQEVTLRRLLSHSSGITGGRDFSRPEGPRTTVEQVHRGGHGFDEAELIHEPGTHFRYANQG